MVRVLITGDSNWICRGLAGRVLDAIIARHGRDVEIIQGAADGVDWSFCEEAWARDLGVCSFAADWDRHGKAGGPIRNKEMVDAGADFCLAVHRNLSGSKGTRDCVRKAIAARIPVWLIELEYGKHRRIMEA